MTRNTNFWILMVLFQVAFGLTVFAATRQYYVHDTQKATTREMMTEQASAAWPEREPDTGLEKLISTYSGQPINQDPLVTLSQADEFFSNGQYGKAAELYEQLLASGSGNVNIYNSLGITLHYLGRSEEALLVLNEGVALDSSYQRIWLTLGYVNSQLGNTAQARTALTTAVQMGADNDVGQSAMKMLDALP